MANKTKKKASTPASSSDDNVVRIKASTSSPKKREVIIDAMGDKPVAKAKKERKERKAGRRIRGGGVFRSIGGYFKGAWVELRQVRWPNRQATWSLTGAVLIYTAFFVVLILLLDAGFNYLFELILGQ